MDLGDDNSSNSSSQKSSFPGSFNKRKPESIANIIVPEVKTSKAKGRRDYEGNMSDSVGVGKHAKTNIIWYVVSATFVIFSCIALALIILMVYGYKINDITQSIKDIWGIFTPILTLALGYLFGEQKRNSKSRKNKREAKS